MLLITLFWPLIGFLTASLFGRWIGSTGSAILTTTLLALSTLSGLNLAASTLLLHDHYFLPLSEWIPSGLTHTNLTLTCDPLTGTMLVVVTSISLAVHSYSREYMQQDPHLPRFVSYLSLFTFFMLILITSNNLPQLFIGWEGVGVCSYLLINFWYTRIEANKAAILAMVANRVGDLALLIAIMILQFELKTIEFDTLFATAQHTTQLYPSNTNFILIATIMLFLAAVGKSAQLGLHTWLPTAMEGPTPVSALIHAATMVTAGVFLILRTSPLFELSPPSLAFVTTIGAATAFFAATIGLIQHDIKRVIAYSTCSQLGFMVFTAGLSQYSIALFHLGNHAFFKALLFLGAGAVIHGLGDEQDVRRLGGAIHKLPFTYSVLLIASLALTGFPYLAGFYSKDAILEVAFSSYTISGTFAFWLGTLATFCTAFYSWRLIYLTFLSSPNESRDTWQHSHEPSWWMTIPLTALAIASISTGYLLHDLFLGLGSPAFNNILITVPERLHLLDAEFLPSFLTPLIVTTLGASSALWIYSTIYYHIHLLSLNSSFIPMYSFLQKRWYFDQLYSGLTQLSLHLGHILTYKTIDRGLLEWLGPTGISSLVKTLATQMTSLQSGHLFRYSFLIFAALTTLLLAETMALQIHTGVIVTLILTNIIGRLTL